MATTCCTRPVVSSSTRSLVLRASNSPCYHVLRPCVDSAKISYAQVGAATFVGSPPSPPGLTPHSRTSPAPQPLHVPPARAFDAHVLSELQNAATDCTQSQVAALTPLTELVEQYMERSGYVLDASLPYESRPNVGRRAQFSKDEDADADVSTADGALVMVAHAVHDRTGKHKVAYSSGFVVRVLGMPDGQDVLVTCAHTLEEIRHDPLMRAARPSSAVANDQLLSGSFVISGSAATPAFRPVTSVLSALHRGDVLLLSSPPRSPSDAPLRSLPVNPYPVHPGTPIRAHFVANKPPETGPHREGWTPWVGGTWRKWVKGNVLGYRDYAGREAKPGTYDSLAHLHFDPPPTPGSSGGPIIDEESGSVIGVILGNQLVSQVEGMRGWGVPAEMIFEMFSLPGLKLKSQSQ